MRDIMVDLETMDNVPTAAIVAIGAVQCDLTAGELGAEYYRVVNLEGQQEKGLTISAGTVYWWLGQSDGAREALLIAGKISLEAMCTSFNRWLASLTDKNDNPISTEHLRLWGNGASFDNAILTQAYRVCNKELDVKFWNNRDMRTLVGFYPKSMQAEWRRTHFRKGVHHNALHDAIHQVEYCSDILKELGVNELL